MYELDADWYSVFHCLQSSQVALIVSQFLSALLLFASPKCSSLTILVHACVCCYIMIHALCVA